MKIALCISNHLRSFERTFPFIKQAILDKYKCDCFIHTWNTIGYDGIRGDFNVKNSFASLDRLIELFNPKDVLIETMPKFDVSKYKLHSGVRNAEIIKGMYYSIMRSNELKTKYEQKQNVKYDIVIRSRADLLFKNKLEIEENLKYIYIPAFGAYGGIPDQFAYGTSELMNKYCNTYNNIDQLYIEGCPYQGESLLKENLNFYNIETKKSNINYSLLRANGSNFELER